MDGESELIELYIIIHNTYICIIYNTYIYILYTPVLINLSTSAGKKKKFLKNKH